MLVLTRKISQSISIGDNVKLTLLSIDGDRISIGIDAPKEVKIFRSELLDETRSINKESNISASGDLSNLKKHLASGKGEIGTK